jgi:uncharacterized BrkB/YihY/UPF0761 family membrane protein
MSLLPLVAVLLAYSAGIAFQSLIVSVPVMLVAGAIAGYVSATTKDRV